MTQSLEPLTDAELEAATQILFAWYQDQPKTALADAQEGVKLSPNCARAMLAAARTAIATLDGPDGRWAEGWKAGRDECAANILGITRWAMTALQIITALKSLTPPTAPPDPRDERIQRLEMAAKAFMAEADGNLKDCDVYYDETLEARRALRAALEETEK